jgi:hypothetical protein
MCDFVQTMSTQAIILNSQFVSPVYLVRPEDILR